MISLPSSGSTWIANHILKSDPGLLGDSTSHNEFFNPGRNQIYAENLSTVFGPYHGDYSQTSILSKYRKKELRKVFRRTWKCEKYNFTKENHLAFKIDFFSRRFETFVLYRHRKHTFPPSMRRAGAVAWYNGLFAALRSNYELLPVDIKSALDYCNKKDRSEMEKACAAHIISFHQIFKDASKHGIPVIDFKRLVSEKDEHALSTYLGERLPVGIFSAQLVSSIISSANDDYLRREKQYEDLGVEKFSSSLVEQLSEFSSSNSRAASNYSSLLF